MPDLKPFLLDPARHLEAAAADLQHVLNLANPTAEERCALLSLMPSLQPLLRALVPTGFPPLPRPPAEPRLGTMFADGSNSGKPAPRTAIEAASRAPGATFAGGPVTGLSAEAAALVFPGDTVRRVE